MFAFCFSLLVSSAFADIPPSDLEGCEGRAAGASCKTDAGKSGACVDTTCSKLDYSNGTPPSSVNYDCRLCDASAKPAEEPGCNVVSGGTGLVVMSVLLAVPLLRRRRVV